MKKTISISTKVLLSIALVAATIAVLTTTKKLVEYLPSGEAIAYETNLVTNVKDSTDSGTQSSAEIEQNDELESQDKKLKLPTIRLLNYGAL